VTSQANTDAAPGREATFAPRLPSLVSQHLLTALTVLFALAWAYPLYGAFLASINPTDWLGAYFGVLTTTMMPIWYLNSFATSVITTFGVLAIGATCGYAISQLDFPGRKILWFSVIAAFIVPMQALMISHFFLMHQFGLLNGWLGVALPQILAPLSIIVYKQHFDGLPKELREAGIMDAASEFRLLWRVYLPLSSGITAGLGIVTFIGAWNAFLWPFLAVTHEEKFNVAVAIDQVRGNGLSTAVMAALPVVIVYLIFHRRIIDAVTTSGSVKG
jgi:multiple sugar transport system permease protein